jgi:preprotein translocase subunit YajC
MLFNIGDRVTIPTGMEGTVTMSQDCGLTVRWDNGLEVTYTNTQVQTMPIVSLAWAQKNWF